MTLWSLDEILLAVFSDDMKTFLGEMTNRNVLNRDVDNCIFFGAELILFADP